MNEIVTIRELVIAQLYAIEKQLVAVDCALMDGDASPRTIDERAQLVEQITGIVHLLADLQRAHKRRLPVAFLLADLEAQRDEAERTAPDPDDLAAARAMVERDQQRRLLRARASLLALVVEDLQRITADTGR